MRVAVLAGGRSSEHEVSLESAASVREGLTAAAHDVLWVDLGRDGTWSCEGEEVALRAGGGLLDADAVFPALHGPFGEDGSVQGTLEVLDVPYVGSGVLASALCMDKVIFKDVMGRAGLPQVPYWSLDATAGVALADPSAVSYPCWVKPARLGSSVGIARVDAPDELEAAIKSAAAHDPRVIVEACARGLVVPARIPDAARERVREVAVTAFRLAGCSGLARADFFVDGDDVLLNELNTMPGFTQTSVYGKLWDHSGIRYPELCDRLVRIAIERFERERLRLF